MAESFLFVILIFVVVIITAVIFGGWVILNVLRGIAALLGITPKRSMAPVRRVTAAPPRKWVSCGVAGCRHANPATARFCRHCGHLLSHAQSLAA